MPPRVSSSRSPFASMAARCCRAPSSVGTRFEVYLPLPSAFFSSQPTIMPFSLLAKIPQAWPCWALLPLGHLRGRSILAQCHDGATEISHEMHSAGSWHLQIPLQSCGDHQVVPRQIPKSTSGRGRTRRVRVTAVTVEQLCSDHHSSFGWNAHFRVTGRSSCKMSVEIEQTP